MSEADRFVQWVADCWLAGFSLIEILDSIRKDWPDYKHCALETFDFLETQAESRGCTTSY